MNDTVTPLPLISIALILVLLYSVISILKPLPPLKRRWRAFVCASLAFIALVLTGSLMETPTEETPPSTQAVNLESTDSKTETPTETPTEETPTESISPTIQPSEIESTDSISGTAVQDVKIKCDVFDIKSHIENEELMISLDTDCPDYSEITISVRRTFYEVGTTNAYSRSYFQEKSTVGDWRTQRTISVAHAEWLAELESHRQEMTLFGSDFIVDRISDDIEISMVIPINQEDKRFGHRNSNLVGKAVNTTGLRIIESDVSISYPLQETPVVAPVLPLSNTRTLDLNQSYRLSEETPLMAEPDPDDPTAAEAETEYLKAGSIIRIKAVSTMQGSPWYNVDAADAAGSHVGTGWIDGVALLGQNLEPLPSSNETDGVELIGRVQRMLSELGYEPGPIDGVMGPTTTSAIRAFQEANGLTVDGAITDGLIDAMLPPPVEIAPEVAPEAVPEAVPEAIGDEQLEQGQQSPAAACPTLDGDGVTEVAQWLEMGVSDDNLGSLFKITPECAKEWREALEG